MSFKSDDLKKISRSRRAEDQGWRVEKGKEYWVFYPLDKRGSPVESTGTPSSSPIVGELPLMHEAKGV